MDEQQRLDCTVARRIFLSGRFAILLVLVKNHEQLPVTMSVSSKERVYMYARGNDLPTEGNIILYGKWQVNSKTNRTEFYAVRGELAPIKTTSGAIRLLSGKGFPGIGRRVAEEVVKEFGCDPDQIYDQMFKAPGRALSLPHMTQERYTTIIKGLESKAGESRIMSFLSKAQIGPETCKMIYAEYKGEAIRKIQENPYQLTQIHGIGFSTCDKIAFSLGVALDSLDRVDGAIQSVLKEATESGNLYLTGPDMFQQAMERLNKQPGVNDGKTYDFVSPQRLTEGINYAVQRKHVVFHKDPRSGVQEFYYSLCEKDESRPVPKVVDLCFVPTVGAEECWKVLNTYDKKRLSDKQKQAVITSMTSRASVITGGPGTGKSTIMDAVIYVYKQVCEGEITLLAPTGKAARRMTEATGITARTIHSALGIFDEVAPIQTPIPNGLIIVDEFSMVDQNLFAKLMDAVQDNEKNHIIFVGDVDQLPSVKAGDVLNQIIKSGVVPITRLTEIFRQKEGGRIVENALRINTGRTDLDLGPGFTIENASSEDEALKKIVELYLRETNKWGADNAVILCPRRSSQGGRFKVVSEVINKSLQDAVNPASQSKRSRMVKCSITGSEVEYREGDRIMQWKNTKKSANGDVATLTKITEDEDNGLWFTVRFETGEEQQLSEEEMQTFTLAYCMTIHKSQGSEYKSVIIPLLSGQKCGLFRRNMLYTGVTRAKENVILVGDQPAVQMCIRTVDNGKRATNLAVRLQSARSRKINASSPF